MKIVMQNKPSHGLQYAINHMAGEHQFAVIQKCSDVIKTLVSFEPDVLFLHDEDLDQTIRHAINAYTKKKKRAQLVILKNGSFNLNDKSLQDIVRPSVLSIDRYDPTVQKKDISVFIDSAENEGICQILASSFDVKIYGRHKVHNPMYLGMPTDQDDFFSILNASKYVIDLGTYVYADSIFFRCIPIVYSPMKVDAYPTFNNPILSCSAVREAFKMQESDLSQVRLNALKASDLGFVKDLCTMIGTSTQSIDEKLKSYEEKLC